MHRHIELSGRIWGVFAHRFAVETAKGKMLVDIGPKAAERLSLREGDRVEVEGETKPSAIKAHMLVDARGRRHAIDWPAKRHKHDKHGEADPGVALDSVRAEGYSVTRAPKRKPKHWEVLAERDGAAFELHVELDGRIRKVKRPH
ncbi:MAG: hypothetical protein KGM42_04495 [Hyphomicrobiales bacterium]|nr:hypothetical protein [Hyphomicrobiales bacterium]